ncbi:MAG TPA: OmpA family protein [Thermoanaerobaculia bacterium]|nr:OmpA family protein [Thermoanaerobaculia bacterium]
MRAPRWAAAPTVILALVATTGCATKKYVQTENKAIHTRIDEVQGQVEQTQTRLDTQDKKVTDVQGQVTQVQGQVGEVSKTAQEALDRAQEAGKLAEGKLLYETVLTDEKVKFGVNKHKLSAPARAALDEFANQLKEQNKPVYIEIQGHTDNAGNKDYNEKLGMERAEAVREYLNKEHHFPLHRINVISYGEAEPVANNKTRTGRAQNRRVALVVLS